MRVEATDLLTQSKVICCNEIITVHAEEKDRNIKENSEMVMDIENKGDPLL